MSTSVEQAISDLLTEATPLTALVGTRITWLLRGEATGWPAVVLTSVSSIPEYSDEGAAGLRFTRLQIDCWAIDAGGLGGATIAINVAAQVRAALANIEINVDGVDFECVMAAEDGVDSVEQGQGGLVEYRRRLEYELWNTEG